MFKKQLLEEPDAFLGQRALRLDAVVGEWPNTLGDLARRLGYAL